MQYFKMGEKVIVHATMYWKYEDGEKKWLRKQLPEPKKAFYVGYTYKQEGTLAFHTEGSGWDVRHPYLTNIKSIKLLRIKFADWRNDEFALLQDVRRIRE